MYNFIEITTTVGSMSQEFEQQSANDITKARKQYFTTVKIGTRWYSTNRFDPRVVAHSLKTMKIR
jgi:hypothetical protein